MTNNILEVIKSRRSVRVYKEEQIKDEELQQILEGELWAPSGTNEQILALYCCTKSRTY